MTAATVACAVLLPVPQPLTPSPDDDLTERLADDLDAAFPDVVDRYERSIYALALRLSGPAVAEDLAAETFLRAYAGLRHYPTERVRSLAVRPWLVTILLNRWRNEKRAARRNPTPVGVDDVAEPAAPGPGPEEAAASRDLRERLADLLTRLPERQRLAVTLRHVGELSYAEVADVLGVPEGTAKSHVSRGLTALRALAIEAGLEEALS